MSGFCLYTVCISDLETKHIPLHLLQLWQAQFNGGDLDYIWNTVGQIYQPWQAQFNGGNLDYVWDTVGQVYQPATVTGSV